MDVRDGSEYYIYLFLFMQMFIDYKFQFVSGVNCLSTMWQGA